MVREEPRDKPNSVKVMTRLPVWRLAEDVTGQCSLRTSPLARQKTVKTLGVRALEGGAARPGEA